MNARKLHLSLNFDFSCLLGTANQYRCRPPLHSTRISIDTYITYKLSFTLNGKADIFFRQTAYMSQVISHLADHDNEIRAVGNEFFAHLIDIKTKFGAATRRHLFFLAYHFAINDSFCHHFYVLPISLSIAIVSCLEEVPSILEDHKTFLYRLHPTMFTVVHRQADAVAIAEDGYVSFRELRHFVGNSNDWQSCLLLCYSSKHIECRLFLTEGIIDTSPIGVRMITTLMVERMPQTTTYELSCCMEQFLC